MYDMDIIVAIIDKYADKSWDNGNQEGMKEERQRVLFLWDEEMACQCEEAMQHLRRRIEGEN